VKFEERRVSTTTLSPDVVTSGSYCRVMSDWLSTGEAAGRLGVESRRLYELIDGGALPAYRFGRVIRLRLDDVQRYIDDQGDDGLAGVPARI
jgi:excisionase family DNA binding protein